MTKETMKESGQKTGSQSAKTLDYKHIIESMVIRRFGTVVSNDQLAKFLGFENGVIPKSRITSLKSSMNSLDIDDDGSILSAKLARWLIHKNRLSAVYAGQLFGYEGNMDLLMRFPRTWREAVNTKSPYYFEPAKKCAFGHLNVRRAANRECMFCIIADLENQSRTRATKRLFGVTDKEAEPVVEAFDKLPEATKVAIFDRFIGHIPPEIVTSLATAYLEDPKVRQAVGSEAIPEAAGFFSAVNAWGKTRKTSKVGQARGTA
ncbi:hypothetical protein [Ferrovum sp.]|jgi:hypothetical protein|uniref:hypothetical protein n=1 Tax=Ferrovum sp. TaxID=2609467 RepID=UPI0026022D22|nr:hypothetical protein [Ferrovum sp.]